MMIHGRCGTQVWRPSLGIIKVKCEFFGKASHASSWPWRGVNALNAMIQLFVSLDQMRQQIRPEARVHGVITKGGEQANIIPEHTASEFYLRAPTTVGAAAPLPGVRGRRGDGHRLPGRGHAGADRPRSAPAQRDDGRAVPAEPRVHRLPGGPGRRPGRVRVDGLRQREPGAPDDPPLHPHLPGRRARALARFASVNDRLARAGMLAGAKRWPDRVDLLVSPERCGTRADFARA
jgi:hypothetical protein